MMGAERTEVLGPWSPDPIQRDEIPLSVGIARATPGTVSPS